MMALALNLLPLPEAPLGVGVKAQVVLYFEAQGQWPPVLHQHWVWHEAVQQLCDVSIWCPSAILGK